MAAAIATAGDTIAIIATASGPALVSISAGVIITAITVITGGGVRTDGT